MLLERPEAGVLIGVEGVSGVGKTTVSRKLAETVPDARTVPDEVDHDLYRAIREAPEAKDDYYNRHGYPGAEGLLFVSQRLFELQEFVWPALRDGAVVFHDRSFYSPCVYSTVLTLREHPEADRQSVFDRFVSMRERISSPPDHNVLLTDDVDECVDRRDSRDGRRLTEEEREFQRDVYDSFHGLLGDRSDVTVVEVRETPAATARAVTAALEEIPHAPGDD